MNTSGCPKYWRNCLRIEMPNDPASTRRDLPPGGDPGSTHRILRTGGEPGILTGPRARMDASATAYLKIAEGCDNRCAYCAIPMIRGPFRSVSMETLADEATSLAASGVRELVLIAQDVSAYGSDIYGRYALPELLGKLAKETDVYEKDSFAELPGKCAEETNINGNSVLPEQSGKRVVESVDSAGKSKAGIEWLRLMYCYEERVTDELIEAIAKYPGVCNYIDIPLQHISDSVLGRMGRRSTCASIEKTIAKLRSAVPDIAIRTTFMTGFPGESEEDFAALMDFTKEQRFERLGVFAYSPEDGTRAANMPDQIPREIAEERRDALMRQQIGISLEKNRRFIGRTLHVLVEALDPGEDIDANAASICYIGRTEYDAPEIDGSVIFTSNEPLPIGTFAQVLITDAMDYDLVGKAEKDSRFR